MEVNLDAKFAAIPEQSRCFACGKQLTRTLNDRGRIHFCANKHCGNAGYGYLETHSGLRLDGHFTDALNELRKMQW